MTIWHIIAFIIGGTVGFVICSVLTINVVAELEAEINRLGKYAEPHKTGSLNVDTKGDQPDVFNDYNPIDSEEGEQCT